MIWAYLAGLLTLPLLYGGYLGAIIGAGLTSRMLWKHGWSVEWHNDRDTESIPDWRLLRNIWFERTYGPFYAGHWVRQDSFGTDKPRGEWVTRWLSLGNPNGRSLSVYHLRLLELEREPVHG